MTFFNGKDGLSGLIETTGPFFRLMLLRYISGLPSQIEMAV